MSRRSKLQDRLLQLLCTQLTIWMRQEAVRHFIFKSFVVRLLIDLCVRVLCPMLEQHRTWNRPTSLYENLRRTRKTYRTQVATCSLKFLLAFVPVRRRTNLELILPVYTHLIKFTVFQLHIHFPVHLCVLSSSPGMGDSIPCLALWARAHDSTPFAISESRMELLDTASKSSAHMTESGS